jgi:Putative MetA-pathway of phenol degradation
VSKKYNYLNIKILSIMKKINSIKNKLFLVFQLLTIVAQAQNFTDGILMPNHTICAGVLGVQDQFDNYWEGTTQRMNQNMGVMKMQGIVPMVNYGITDKLNVLAMLPYLRTNASAGVMSGWSGFQDMTIGLKYKALKINDFELISTLNGTLPSNNYVAGHPLAIGNQCNAVIGRAILHYWHPKGWTATAQAGYIVRSNIKIDANNYFTTQVVNSNEVAMADQTHYSLRTGYYTYRFGIEAIAEQMTTLGGFDIRRNDMMFPSNKMDATRIGVITHYRIKPLKDLHLVANIAYTLEGRNVGQALTTQLGAFIAFDFKNKKVLENSAK